MEGISMWQWALSKAHTDDHQAESAGCRVQRCLTGWGSEVSLNLIANYSLCSAYSLALFVGVQGLRATLVQNRFGAKLGLVFDCWQA